MRSWPIALVVVPSLVTACGSSASVPTPRFVDETSSSGLDHTYDGEFEFFVGGGVATFDCNDDAFPDVYVAGGSRPAALFINRSTVGGPLRFARLSSEETDLDRVTGAYPLDIDNDGFLDLVVLRNKDTRVLTGHGDCTFTDATREFAINLDDRWTVGFAATWEEGQSLPTLAFGNYLVPDTYDCDTNTLYRPLGGAYRPSVEIPGYCTLSMLFSDWNRDGHRDLRVSNDRNYSREAREQLWRIEKGADPREFTEADGWKSLTIWGMGIASADLTGDGRPEIFLSSQADNKLQELDAGSIGPSYHDIALERGVTAQRPYVGESVLPSTAWHPQFEDVNNDGLLDLFISKGNVDAQIDYASFDPNNLLLGQSDGKFVESGHEAGIDSDTRSRGAALVDLNLDGLLDLVVVNRRVPVSVMRNTMNEDDARWIQIRVSQPDINTQAVGAWVDVRVGDSVTTREITVGGGHASGGSGWMHFGLGKATTADVRVTYPDGTISDWATVDADGFYAITKDESAPTPVSVG